MFLIVESVVNCGYIVLRLVFWYRMCCVSLMKWVVGVVSMMFCMVVGMFLCGVNLLDSSCSGSSMSMSNILNCGMLCMSVVRKIFNDVVVNRCNVILVMNSGMELGIGMCRVLFMMYVSDVMVVIVMMSFID